MPTSLISLADQLAFWNDWHQRRGATGNDLGHRDSRRVFLDAVARTPGCAVADLGCGQGHDLVAFAAAGHEVHGLDFSEEAVRQARNALQEVGVPDVERRVRIGDLASALPYPDGRFQGIFSHLAVQYFDDRTTQAIVDEIGRVLRPGGVLVLVVKSTDDPYCGQGQQIAHHTWVRKGRVRRFFADGELKDLLAGWEIGGIESFSGHYASTEPSDFLRVVAHLHK